MNFIWLTISLAVSSISFSSWCSAISLKNLMMSVKSMFLQTQLAKNFYISCNPTCQWWCLCKSPPDWGRWRGKTVEKRWRLLPRWSPRLCTPGDSWTLSWSQGETCEECWMQKMIIKITDMFCITLFNSPAITEIEMREVSILLYVVIKTFVQNLWGKSVKRFYKELFW